MGFHVVQECVDESLSSVVSEMVSGEVPMSFETLKTKYTIDDAKFLFDNIISQQAKPKQTGLRKSTKIKEAFADDTEVKHDDGDTKEDPEGDGETKLDDTPKCSNMVGLIFATPPIIPKHSFTTVSANKLTPRHAAAIAFVPNLDTTAISKVKDACRVFEHKHDIPVWRLHVLCANGTSPALKTVYSMGSLKEAAFTLPVSIHVSKLRECTYPITRHEIVPKMFALNREEAQAIYKRHKVRQDQLSKMPHNDPQALARGYITGNVIYVDFAGPIPNRIDVVEPIH